MKAEEFYNRGEIFYRKEGEKGDTPHNLYEFKYLEGNTFKYILDFAEAYAKHIIESEKDMNSNQNKDRNYQSKSTYYSNVPKTRHQGVRNPYDLSKSPTRKRRALLTTEQDDHPPI